MEQRRRRRRRPPYDFVHEKCDRFTWEQFIRRADLPEATKTVAWAMATWASPDGGDIIVPDELLADALERKPRFVREHHAILRDYGLIEALTKPAPGHTVEYQLTTPGPGFDPVPMRLDMEGNRLTPRPEGRAGKRRPVKNPGSGRPGRKRTGDEETGTREPSTDADTGTREPVDNPEGGTREPVNNPDGGTRAPLYGPEQRHPGTADPDNTGTRAHEHRFPGAPTPAPGCHPPLQDQPRPSPGVQSYVTLARAGLAPEPARDRHDETNATTPPPTDLEYARASKALRAANPLARDRALSAARQDLAAEDIPADNRRLTVRAAALLPESRAA